MINNPSDQLTAYAEEVRGVLIKSFDGDFRYLKEEFYQSILIPLIVLCASNNILADTVKHSVEETNSILSEIANHLGSIAHDLQLMNSKHETNN